MSTILHTTSGIRLKAGAWTLLIHLLLFLFFWLFRYALPAPVHIEELGMEVNLGTDKDGFGNDQPMRTGMPAAFDPLGNPIPENSVADASGSILRSNDPDAPAITSTEDSSGTDPAATAQDRNIAGSRQAIPTSPAQQPRYVYSGSAGTDGNRAMSDQPGSSEGNTSGSGDRGVPGGSSGTANYTGHPGNGTGGMSHNLSGREISPRHFTAEFNEGGRVVVRVTVNRAGELIRKEIKSSPSPSLSNIALQKLSQAKFSTSRDAAPEQIGEVTIIFKTRS